MWSADCFCYRVQQEDQAHVTFCLCPKWLLRVARYEHLNAFAVCKKQFREDYPSIAAIIIASAFMVPSVCHTAGTINADAMIILKAITLFLLLWLSPWLNMFWNICGWPKIGFNSPCNHFCPSHHVNSYTVKVSLSWPFSIGLAARGGKEYHHLVMGHDQLNNALKCTRN
jgi:hypothetical protein